MFRTALRWMGARWWAAAALAATMIISFRMTGVDAPSSSEPYSFVHPGAHEVRVDAGPVNASFRKEPSASASKAADLEFLALRNELLELKRSLRLSQAREALYSESYEDVSRQYGEISRLAALLMEEAEQERLDENRTPDERALVERARTLMEARAQGREAVAKHASAQQASAPRHALGVPVPAEAIFIHTAQASSDPKQ